ncbi:MAG TPA: antibiotic biosynthesis monooxygenase family protein [Ktedonobacteraceae bacterium]|jgi:quinol monooxygenase YgiN|nr:antibiotic biosynthesis monooxygenase family protein [Ktedonobacteraceae bacterium]
MITEIALITAATGKEDELGQAILKGLNVIRQHPECISSRVERCIEQPKQYMVINIWTSLEAHMQDFRGSPLFPQWRRYLEGLTESAPIVFHYQPF